MHTQQTSTRIFRVFAALAVMVLVFSQFGAAGAEGPKPPKLPAKEKVTIAAPNLDEVQTFFGRLSETQAKLGVVVELQATPSALIYAQSQGAQAVDLAKAQTALVQKEQAGFMSALQTKAIQYKELYRTQKVYNGIWLRLDSKDIPALLNLPGVKAIHPMIPKNVDHTTSVPLIGAPQVWDGLAGILGENIRVGVIDTGIDYIHTNFGGPGSSAYATQDFTVLTEQLNLFPTTKVVGGYDFAGDGYSAGITDPSPDPDPMDCNGHGSHVSGSVAGYGVLTDGTTFTEAPGDTYADLAALTPAQYIAKFRIGPGVAPKAKLYALRVFGCSGSTDLTEQAIEWAMDPNGDGDMSDHLDVINMSLGSNFGTAYDTSAVASNNAALAGVIVATSAGNANDVYYITGAPGMAKYAISTAASVDSGAVVSAFEVKAPAGIAGNYAGVEAAFGPLPGIPGTTADIAVTTPANGCTAISTVLTGKIALIDRGACTFKTKVLNAQLAGAVGVLVANNAVGFPLSMADDATITTPITIPSMMTTQTIGTMLKTQLAVPLTVNIRLTSQYMNQFQMTDSSIEDTLASFSSRGPARGNLLKPDLTAPGDTIFSTASGTGDQGVSFNGTSMASPHVAGIMALLRQLHPTWSVAQLKALVMNTATSDLWTSAAHTAMYPPTRIGAGRVSVAKAAQTDAIAYYTNDPGQVSLSFGEVEITGTQDLVKSITLSNKSVDPASYTVTFDPRYQANPGLTYTLLDENGAALVNPVVLASNSSVQVQLKISIDALALTRARDATIATTGSRQRFAEGGGYVTFTPALGQTLRVPVQIAARPASTMSVGITALNLPLPNAGTLSLVPSGTPVDTIDDTSLVSVLELKAESPNEATSQGSNNAADLRYVGVTSDASFYGISSGSAYFGVSTYGKWDTPSAVEFDVYIDNNKDGVWDYVVFNVNQGFFTTTVDDVMLTAYCDLHVGGCNADYYTNGFSGTYNSNLFNNNVMVLPVNLSSIGVDALNPAFDFQVVSFNREANGPVDQTDVLSYDVSRESFSSVDPVNTGMPVWLDVPLYSPTIDVAYDKANILDNGTLGLLLLHHHNDANTAEVLRLPPQVKSIKAASPNPTVASSVDFTVTFNSPVSGVDTGDFILTTTGISGASITSVTGSDAVYTVKVNTGAKTGTLRLDLADDDTILNASGARLGGMGVGNGDYNVGDVYMLFRPVTFMDVPSNYWAWGYIERLRAAGITSGCSTNPMNYCPESTVTRAQMAIFLLRGIHGASYVPPAAVGNVFGDVHPGDFAADWIEQLNTEGITSGCGGGNFCPNAPVTRAQMAIFLLRSEHTSAYVPPAATGTLFTDVPALSFAADWIEQLAAEGVTAGCGGGNYCPGSSVTRAQMAVFLVRTFKLP